MQFSWSLQGNKWAITMGPVSVESTFLLKKGTTCKAIFDTLNFVYPWFL